MSSRCGGGEGGTPKDDLRNPEDTKYFPSEKLPQISFMYTIWKYY